MLSLNYTNFHKQNGKPAAETASWWDKNYQWWIDYGSQSPFGTGSVHVDGMEGIVLVGKPKVHAEPILQAWMNFSVIYWWNFDLRKVQARVFKFTLLKDPNENTFVVQPMNYLVMFFIVSYRFRYNQCSMIFRVAENLYFWIHYL